MEDAEHLFDWVDYVVFITMLAISACIGIFYAMKDKITTADILVGGQSMGILPVASSIMATFMSAAGLLGLPAELFLYGDQYILATTFIVMPTVTFMSAYFIVPVFYNLGTYSANEYLERRFSRPIRTLSCILYCLTMIFFMGVSLFAPAMALTQVTGIKVWITVWTTGLVCTFYTTIGGMKAVVWTDAFQSVVLLVAMIWILIVGVNDVGGLKKVWKDNLETDRILLFVFDPSPFVRVSVWNSIIGGSIAMLGAFATNQATIQRYLSLPSLRHAKRTIWTAMPMFMIVNLLTLLLGMVIVSKYRYCDPIKTKQIMAADQLFPLFVMDTMGSIPGIPGIFVAGIFSASLSTVSSGINSLTAVLLEDITKLFIWPNLTEKQTHRILKISSIVFGLLCIIAAAFAEYMGNIIQAYMFVLGLLGSPMFGTFILGLFVPYATNKGAVVGLISGFAFNIWMGVGALYNFPYYVTKEKNFVEGCPEKYFNATGNEFNITLNNAIIQTEIDRTESIFPVYRISFMYYMMIGVIIVVGVGTIVSFLTGVPNYDEMETQLFVPLVKEAIEKRQKKNKYIIPIPMNAISSKGDDV